MGADLNIALSVGSGPPHIHAVLSWGMARLLGQQQTIRSRIEARDGRRLQPERYFRFRGSARSKNLMASAKIAAIALSTSPHGGFAFIAVEARLLPTSNGRKVRL
jgi:hypothetical protein